MKILLIEDDFLYAENLKIMLTQYLSIKIGDILWLDSYDSVALISQYLTKIDIVICDIFLRGEKTGLDVLELFQNRNIPVILMTSSHDLDIYQKAKSIRQVNYLVKPIHPITLLSTIEKALFKSDSSFLTIKDHHNTYSQIAYDDIKWIESDGNYSTIVTHSKKIALKISLTKILTKLDNRFQRCHHSYVINTKYLKSVSFESLVILDTVIPLGRTFKKRILARIKKD